MAPIVIIFSAWALFDTRYSSRRFLMVNWPARSLRVRSMSSRSWVLSFSLSASSFPVRSSERFSSLGSRERTDSPFFTASPGFFLTAISRVSPGLEMTCSKFGTVVPVAEMAPSMLPLRTMPVRISSRPSDGRRSAESSSRSAMPPAATRPTLRILPFRRLRMVPLSRGRSMRGIRSRIVPERIGVFRSVSPPVGR